MAFAENVVLESMVLALARESGAAVTGDVCKQTHFHNAYELTSFVQRVLANQSLVNEVLCQNSVA